MKRWGKGSDELLRAYLSAFNQFLQSKKYETRRAYVPAIKQFFTMFRWICPIDITTTHARQFKESLLSNGKKETTTLWRVAAMSSFMKYLSKINGPNGPLVRINPFREISRDDIKPEAFKATSNISLKELSTMLKSEPHDTRGLRDRAILSLILFTKCNREELSQLRVQDLQIKSVPFSVTLRCSQKERVVELPEVVYRTIQEYWLASGRKIAPSSGVFVASSQRDPYKDSEEPLCHDTIRKILKRSAKRVHANGQVRAIKKVSDVSINKLARNLNRYKPIEIPDQYSKISNVPIEKQLVDAYARLLEIEKLTSS